ncbi:hypothetical protein [Lactococcus lactis]|uniref:Uncharacterized protein n=1 Tax=Lactococcus lactis subsp. lactis TaxID=1360 RepID=A0A2R7Y068_LACLL|nr:hypothetical protein [Lactococcus lactis]PUA16167.1 hypothetical protein CYU10_001089 [Lactococcus lactis subsp. lactis]
MTKKEYTFWLLSSIFLIIGLILQFIPSHSIQNASFTALIIGLVLVFFSLRTKMNRENHYPKSFIRKNFLGLGFLFHSL